MIGPRKLFIVGDSFATPPKPTDPAMTWTRIVADELSKLTGDAVFIINAALNGSSQDYAWTQLHNWFDANEITERDFVVVCMTHPGRFWFIEKLPEFSNSNIIDLDRWLTKEQSTAVELFIKHIQRPSLDAIHLVDRLNYLAYQTLKRKLNKPVVIKCFKQELYDAVNLEELNMANGSLFEDIQYWEYYNAEEQKDNEYFQGYDVRYNHMCLSNHKILGKRIAESLYTNTTLDLKEGYIRSILQQDSLQDPEFRKRELNEEHYHAAQEQLAKNKISKLPWRKRVGV